MAIPLPWTWLTGSIAACYCWPVLFAFLVSFLAVTVTIVVIEAVQWNLRPAAKRLRHLRRIERARHPERTL